MAGSTDDEDDYLSMTFEDSATAGKDTSLQRTARLKQEAAERARIPSKAERNRQERQARETALATELDASSNKGAQMMAKMGFRGGALGKTEGARTRPIELQIKDDRGGIGMDSLKKRNTREAAAAQVANGEKRQKVDEDQFRERNRAEREEKRAEGQMWGAMKILEGYELDAHASENEDFQPPQGRLRDVNLLYRPLLRQRLRGQHDQWARRELQNSLSARSNSPDEDENPFQGFDKRMSELDDEDPELEEFEHLDFSSRRDKILAELRSKYNYCFWCKFRYEDGDLGDLEGCPGRTEDEHG